MVEFQPFGGVHGHDGDLFGAVIGFIIHDEADMFQKIT